MSTELPDDHYRPTYDEIHLQIGASAKVIRSEFAPDLMVAIGGGGFFPARVLRTFLKRPSERDPSRKINIPIQAIGLSLYEELAGSNVGEIGTEVVRTQWLDVAGRADGAAAKKVEEGKRDAGGLLGKSILIVDEVDDSRTTLQYAYNELLRDVKGAIAALSAEERAALTPTRFAIFVVHNKATKQKRGTLPIVPSDVPRSEEKVVDGVMEGVRYFAGEDLDDVWVEYPWEQEDIVEHNRLAALARQAQDPSAGKP